MEGIRAFFLFSSLLKSLIRHITKLTFYFVLWESVVFVLSIPDENGKHPRDEFSKENAFWVCQNTLF